MISQKVRFAYLLMIGAVLIFAVEACAQPVDITHISADTVSTTFDPTLGTYLGELDFCQYTPIEVDYVDGTSDVYEDGLFHLWTELTDDQSYTNIYGQDIASGYFGGEAFDEDNGFVISYFDEFSVEHILLSGEVVELSLSEVFDDMGFMSGIGNLKITGGEFMNQFGTEGELFDVTFRIDPAQIDDFSVEFSGESDVTIVPKIPEPCSILLLAPAVLGVGGMLIRRRKK